MTFACDSLAEPVTMPDGLLDTLSDFAAAVT
jgi:hypothetical protein